MKLSLQVLNLETATFECVFGRGCEGICCQNGRPSVSPKEAMRIDEILMRALPLLRPKAKKLIQDEGYLSNRRKQAHNMMRVVDGWCVFFKDGCVLHKIGTEDDDSYRYKPVKCALFPLDKDRDGTWYVRQRNYKGEGWELFCLNPKQSQQPAAKALETEIALAVKLETNSSLT